jgi:hypothetical protein
MLIAIIPLVALVAGILMYALAQNAKIVEIGRAMMWCGLLVTLAVAAHQTVKL